MNRMKNNIHKKADEPEQDSTPLHRRIRGGYVRQKAGPAVPAFTFRTVIEDIETGVKEK